MPTVEVICLANSWKHGGRCVAGLRMDGEGWVRPVSSEPEGVLQAQHYTLAGGGEAALLDVLKMRLVGPQPEPHHPENWLMECGQWKRTAWAALNQVQAILQQSLTSGPELLGDCQEKIAYTSLQQKAAVQSLALVCPENLLWQIQENPQGGKRRTRAVFTLAGRLYNLPLTDPTWSKRLSGLPVGCYPWEYNGQEVLLTISLSEPFAKDGFCYKLVAAVVTMPPISTHEGFLEMLRRQWRIFCDWVSV